MATWLTEQLAENNLSMRELARRIEVSHTSIADIINGKMKPSAQMCRKFARVFEIPPEQVFRLAGLLPPIVVNDESAALKQSLDERWQHLSLDYRRVVVDVASSLYERQAEYKVSEEAPQEE